jgi:hypothetical protein
MHHRKSIRLPVCAIAVWVLSGCGHGGRMPLEGTVTLDGRPLKEGAIQFNPLPGTPGPTVGGEIVDGKFTILSSGGPFVGKFSVQITSAGLTGRKVLDPFSNKMIDEYAQCLPPRYNSQSQLQAEVTAAGPNRFDFAIASEKNTR